MIQCSSGTTFGLKDTPNIRIPLSVVCNSDYCNYVTLRKRVHTTDYHLAEHSGNVWKILLISGYLYLLSATVINIIRSRYVNLSTLLIPMLILNPQLGHNFYFYFLFGQKSVTKIVLKIKAIVLRRCKAPLKLENKKQNRPKRYL